MTSVDEASGTHPSVRKTGQDLTDARAADPSADFDGDRTPDDPQIASAPPAASGESPSPGAQSRRSWTLWDLAALTLPLSLALLGSALLDRLVGVDLGKPAVVTMAAATFGVLTLVLIGVAAVRDRPGVAGAGQRLARFYRNPPRDGAAFWLGGITAVPLTALYSPVIIGDADSVRIIAAVQYVRFNGIGFLIDTQDNLLPHLVLRPVIALAGLPGAKLFSILSIGILAGAIAYITRRITGSMWAALAAALALVAMDPMIQRAAYVPMYPAMLTLGYLGCWLAYRAITDPKSGWRIWVLAGVCLALTPEAQGVGVLFLPIPALLLVFARSWRSGLRGVLLVYAAVFVTSIPRLILNLSEGGFSRLISYRTDYWVTEGYVGLIQREFWGYAGVSEPLSEYLGKLPGRFVGIFGDWGWLLLAVAAAALLFVCSRRAKIFVVLALGFFLASIIYKQIPPFPRYYSPNFPGVAILVGVGIAGLGAFRPHRVLARASSGLAAAATLALVVLMVLNLQRTMISVNAVQKTVVDQPFSTFAALINDGKGVIGARSHGVVNVTADIPTYGGQFLTEDEYVTYLSWPSDQAVIDLMNKHDIGWVLITAKRQLELGFHNTWMVPNHGVKARQVDMVAKSPAFCLRADIQGFRLYQLGPCAPGEQVLTG